MAQWFICPYWVSEHRVRRDDADRLYQVDYQLTELLVTNPAAADGELELVFYEARGDGNFYRSDWVGGRWTAPAQFQRFYRPDPSRVFGDHFFTYGWFEGWMSRDDMVIDVELYKISRNMISGGSASGAGGVVENISQRTVQVVPKRAPLADLIAAFFGRRPASPLVFPPGTEPITGERLMAESFRPGLDTRDGKST